MSSGGLFIVSCPGCGRSMSVILADHESVTCDSCGYTGPLSSETVERLGRVFEIIKRLNDSEGLVSRWRKSSLTSSKIFTLIVLGFFVLFALPAVLLSLVSLFLLFGGMEYVPLTLLIGSPGVILLAVAVIFMIIVVWSRRALTSAMVASPPAREGEPVTCRLCGAPLVTGQGPVVSCGYCDSDNVVAAKHLRKATRGRAMAIEDFERKIRRKIFIHRWSTLLAGAAVIVSVFVVPVPVVFFMYLKGCQAGCHALEAEAPLNQDVRYALFESRDGRCVGKLITVRSSEQVFHMSPLLPSEIGNIVVPEGEDIQWIEIEDLVGREVCNWEGPPLGNKAVRGTVERVHGNRLGHNRVVVNELHLRVEATCLIETPDYVCERPKQRYSSDAETD